MVKGVIYFIPLKLSGAEIKGHKSISRQTKWPYSFKLCGTVSQLPNTQHAKHLFDVSVEF